MTKSRFLIVTAAMAVLGVSQASAAENLISTVVEGCKVELETHCKDVTPGEGRILACLFAYQDKLSGRCDYALYDAAAQLEHATGALTYLANECGTDLEKYCAQVQPGEGRVAQCLKTNEAKLSTRCGQAISDIGLEVAPAK